MDPKKLPKESSNFVDNTNRTPTKEFLDNLLIKLNPVYAVRKIKGDLIDRGVIVPEGTEQMMRHAEQRAAAVQESMRKREQADTMSLDGLTPEEVTVILEEIKRRQIRNRK